MITESGSDSSNGCGQSPGSGRKVCVDGKGLLEVYERIVQATEGCSVEAIERMHTTYQQLVFRHRMSWQRDDLLEVSWISFLHTQH